MMIIREYAKYLVCMASIIIVLLLASLICGCGNSLDYPKVKKCDDACRIIFHLNNKTPCRGLNGKQLNLPTFSSFHRQVIKCDTTSDKQKEISQDLLTYYYKHYDIENMLHQEYHKPQGKSGIQKWHAVLIGITCGLLFGVIVFLPCYLSDKKHR